MVTRILVVDDDPTVAEVVTRYFEREGYLVECCADGEAALERALADPPDLVVLDLMLPGMDGLEVCRRLRAVAPVPVIMLTARGDETDRVVGLELGADDYLTKPFSPRELTLRVQSILRRVAAPLAPATDPTLLSSGDLVVDVAAREVRVGGEPVMVTVREFELLVFLMRHPRQVFNRQQLLEQVWGYSFGDHSTVTVHVRRLREKVEPNPADPERIVTVWGVGYRWEPQEPSRPTPAAPLSGGSQ
ncbi:MAG: response regulator transcription factor [Mycobacteriales bacterium]